jgi:hypothetical protein
MKLRHLLFGFTVLSLSLLTTAVDTNAKEELRSQRDQRTTANSFMNNTSLRLVAAKSENRDHARRISKRVFAKIVAAAIKRCGCAAPAQDSDFSTGCITNCLKNNGVSSMTLAACAGTCRMNLVGCAICIGVGEWVVLGCAQYCVWRDVLSYVEEGVSSNRGSPSTRRQKPLTRLASVTSST